MKSLGFQQGVGLALALSLCGSALYALFTQVTGTEPALRLLVGLTAAAYVLFLLHHSPICVGRVATVSAWSAISILSWLFHPDLMPYLLIHIGMLWLVRCLYFHRSLLASLMDLGLQGLSLAAAVWALQQTGSLMLCLWCFFLVQALFVLIPPAGLTPAQSSRDCMVHKSGFQQAHRSAEAALRRICSSH